MSGAAIVQVDAPPGFAPVAAGADGVAAVADGGGDVPGAPPAGAPPAGAAAGVSAGAGEPNRSSRFRRCCSFSQALMSPPDSATFATLTEWRLRSTSVSFT